MAHLTDQAQTRTLHAQLGTQQSVLELLLSRQPELVHNWQPEVLVSRIESLQKALGLSNKEVSIVSTAQDIMLVVFETTQYDVTF